MPPQCLCLWLLAADVDGTSTLDDSSTSPTISAPTAPAAALVAVGSQHLQVTSSSKRPQQWVMTTCLVPEGLPTAAAAEDAGGLATMEVSQNAQQVERTWFGWGSNDVDMHWYNVYAVQHGLLMCACNKMLSAVPGQLCAPCLMAVQHHQATPVTLQELFRQVSKSV